VDHGRARPSMPVCNYEAMELLGLPEDGPFGWRNARLGGVALFRQQCCDRSFAELRGKSLACWCEPGEPCHADVILERANAPVSA